MRPSHLRFVVFMRPSHLRLDYSLRGTYYCQLEDVVKHMDKQFVHINETLKTVESNVATLDNKVTVGIERLDNQVIFW